jgi:hypothetical protein
MTHITDARRLVDDATALGVVPPEQLTRLLELVSAVKGVPAVADPAAALVEAAAAGKAAAQDLSRLVAAAAKAELEGEYLRRLQVSVAQHALRRFEQELRDGAADVLLDGLRPRLDEAANAIGDALTAIDPSWTADYIAKEATPDQTAAWRKMPGLIAKVDQIAALVANFGVHGNFAQLDQPTSGLHNYIRGLRDESLLLTSFDPWRASEVISARRADWRTSPWVRLPLQLNSLPEARERYRAVCEAAWAAAESQRAGRGTLSADGGFVPERRINPFALIAEPAAV